jgi:thiamine biosynthesis protein ThiS
MRVNGKDYPHRAGLTLHSLLDELQIDQRRVAVMQGDDFHNAGKIPDAPVLERDTIEIVTMMQGG